MTIQIQVLSRLIDDKSFSFITLNGLTEDYFCEYKDEFNFIKNHFEIYSKVPDKETFQNKFQEISLVNCLESEEYLLKALQEDYLFGLLTDVLEITNNKNITDANDAFSFLLGKLPDLTTKIGIQAKDLTKDAQIRFDAYMEDRKKGNYELIYTGLKELDELLIGWIKGEDLVTVLGFSNEGKSWLLYKFAIAAWLQNKRVAIYSGEMSSNLVGYRVDTLLEHFSNKDLLYGNKLEKDEYEEYINKMKTKDNPLIVITEDEIGGELTISKINALIDKYKLDVFAIDQYSSMQDETRKRGDNTKTQYKNIMKGLRRTISNKKVLILGAVQANRESMKKGKEDALPGLVNISDAHEISALSTKVVSLRNVEAGLKIKVAKNTHGPGKNEELLYFWDINRGDFKFIPSNDSPEKDKKENKKKYQDKTDVF